MKRLKRKKRKKQNQTIYMKKKTRVIVTNVAPSVGYSAWDSILDAPEPWSIHNFKENFKIKIISQSEDELVFDMIGIDASIANAFRRILIAEVPTMAIEKVAITNNTSIIQDEVLAHRLGLIPIKADPRKYEYYKDNEPLTSNNTIQFKLESTCKKLKEKMSMKMQKFYRHN